MKNGWRLIRILALAAIAAGSYLAIMRMPETEPDPGAITLFLAGDVMTGRGIDQILPHPGAPDLHEPYVKNAADYVALAERANGPIPRAADFSYVWGDALEQWRRADPDVRIVNLETSITTSDDWWQGKSVHYRMHPENIPVLAAADFDVLSLANNHVLDWGYAGLEETLGTLKKSGIIFAGAGENQAEAERPAVIDVTNRGRVVVIAIGSESSGIPDLWSAGSRQPGVHLLADLSDSSVETVRRLAEATEREGDLIVASIHWGSNWGYDVPESHQEFAHRLIDSAGIDVVHGHSSHHPRPFEIYKGKPIFYGCGDFLTDYEGIAGHEMYRGDLAIMYFVRMDPVTGLLKLWMVPLKHERFQLKRAGPGDVQWLQEVFNREGARFGTHVEIEDGNLVRREIRQ